MFLGQRRYIHESLMQQYDHHYGSMYTYDFDYTCKHCLIQPALFSMIAFVINSFYSIDKYKE